MKTKWISNIEGKIYKMTYKGYLKKASSSLIPISVWVCG